MSELDRRTFVRALALTGFVTGAEARGKNVVGPIQGSAQPQPAKDVARSLAGYVVSARAADLPANVRKEATRTLLN